MIENANKRKHDIHFIKNQFIKHGYTPLFDDYVHCESKLPCVDKNGYKGLLSYNNLITGYSFGVFKTNNPYIVENMNNFIKINEIPVKLLTSNIYNFTDKLDFMCECGNIYQTSWGSFVDQMVFRCPVCSKKKSTYAVLTENYLNNNNIIYDTEYKILGCQDKDLLRFDYCIKNQDKFILLEVDGQFHYKISYGGEYGLSEQQRRDEIKNQFCKENNIPLIRVPYWEFKNDNYKQIIMEGVKIIQPINTPRV
jgi:hypothetical protein